MIDENGTEWVDVVLPASNGKAKVTKQAFTDLYEEKGWVLADDQPKASEVPERPVSDTDPTAVGKEGAS